MEVNPLYPTIRGDSEVEDGDSAKRRVSRRTYGIETVSSDSSGGTSPRYSHHEAAAVTPIPHPFVDGLWERERPVDRVFAVVPANAELAKLLVVVVAADRDSPASTLGLPALVVGLITRLALVPVITTRPIVETGALSPATTLRLTLLPLSGFGN